MWFLRIFFLLCLFAPLLARLPYWAKISTSLLFFAFSDISQFFNISWLESTIYTKHLTAMAISAYLLGLALAQKYTAAQIQQFFMNRPVLPWLMFGLFGAIICLQRVFPYPLFRYEMMPYILPVVISNQLAICWLSIKYAPRFSQWLSKFAASTFFIFIAHWPIMELYRSLASKYHWAWLTATQPILIFASCYALFFILNRIPYASEWICYTPHKKWRT